MYLRNRIYITRSGFEKLKEKLDELDAEQSEVGKQLRSVLEEGSIEENVDWDTAKSQQRFLEKNINEIHAVLKSAILIKKPSRSSTVVLGSTVHLKHNGKKAVYSIVGSLEADPKRGRISHLCPIGQSVMGKQKGEQVNVKIGPNTETYKIVKVS